MKVKTSCSGSVDYFSNNRSVPVGNVDESKRNKKETVNAFLKSKLDPSGYLDRFYLFNELGYHSYSDYLRGSLWSSIRSRVLEKSNQCYCCDSKEFTQIHHYSYTIENLCGKSLDGLLPLCRECHRKAHHDESGKMVAGLRNVNKRIYEMRHITLDNRPGMC